MANIYERLLSTIITTRKKTGTRSIPEVKPLSGEDSTWMVDRLEIPRIVDSLLLAFPFFLHD